MEVLLAVNELWKSWLPNFVEGESQILQISDPDSESLARQVVGSREAALETVLVLRQVVSKARFSNIDQLVTLIRSVGRRLVEAQPKGLLQFASDFSPVHVSLLHFVYRTQCGEYSSKNPSPHTRRV